ACTRACAACVRGCTASTWLTTCCRVRAPSSWARRERGKEREKKRKRGKGRDRPHSRRGPKGGKKKAIWSFNLFSPYLGCPHTGCSAPSPLNPEQLLACSNEIECPLVSLYS